MRVVRFLGSCGLTFTLATVSCGSDSTGKAVPDGGSKSDAEAAGGNTQAGGGGGASGASAPGTGGTSRGGAGTGGTSAGTGGSKTDGGTVPDDAGPELSSDGAIIVPSNDHCTSPKTIALSAATPHFDIRASTFGATHDVDAPCQADSGPDVFYELVFSRRVFLYADTFGAKFDTVLFLTSKDCVPIAAAATAGTAVCNDDACGTSQSRLVALLEPGYYRLGLGGRGAAEGAATIHVEWTLAGNGAVKELPKGDSVQTGTTKGSGNIDGKSSTCLAAAAEDSFFWASCPDDAGGSLTASTCGGGATWETVLETEIPQSAPYTCSLDACGLQSSLTQAIPAGAGLRVLSIDGDSGGDLGAYSMTVSRP
jgi:hypothetical protein